MNTQKSKRLNISSEPLKYHHGSADKEFPDHPDRDITLRFNGELPVSFSASWRHLGSRLSLQRTSNALYSLQTLTCT